MKINCRLCQSSKFKKLFEVKRYGKSYTVVECADCGLIFVNPQPSQKEIQLYYQKNYDYSYMEKTTDDSRFYQEELSLLEKELGGKGLLLDIGCGSGQFLAQAQKMGWKTQGVEFSAKTADFGRKIYGVKITVSNFFKFSTKEKFDIITMHHFLEHATNPFFCILKANQLLKTNGFLLLLTPNIESFDARISGKRWEWLSPSAHLFFFSLKTLTRMLKKSNFELVRVKTIRKDAKPLFLSLLNAGLFRLGFWNFAKTRVDKEKKKGRSLESELRGSILIKIINFVFQPLNFFLNKISLGPELLIVAKKQGGQNEN